MANQFKLFDYIDSRGQNDIKNWTNSLESTDRGKLNAKLDMLSKLGPALFPHVLTDTPIPGINKLRVKGKVQLRPMLCKGPINIENEFTLLIGAKEIGGKLTPTGVVDKANTRKETVLNDSNRRKEHERVS